MGWFDIYNYDNVLCFSSDSVKINFINCISVDEISNNSDIKIYPNPTDNKLYIELRENKPIIIEIFNLLGKAVYKNNVKTNFNIDISILAKGIFILRIKDENGNILKTQKIVKE